MRREDQVGEFGVVNKLCYKISLRGCLFIYQWRIFCANHRVFRGNRGGISRRQQIVRGGGDFEIAAKDEGK